MSLRPKLLLLIPHLGGGGAERVMELLARHLSPAKYELHLGLITQAKTGGEGLPPELHLHALGATRVRAGALDLLRLVRRTEPQLILSGMAHLNFLVLLLRPFFPRETRVLVRQNSTVSATLAAGGLPCYTRLLYRWLYRRADRIICQTNAMAEDLSRELGLANDKLAVLPNPVDVAEIRGCAGQAPWRWSGCGPHLLAVGRLTPEKGFDLLLKALAQLRKEFPEADLLIAGTGPEETALKVICRAMGLERSVCFAGYVAAAWTRFADATLYVLPSRHEGLPNALLEAAAAGLPIVSLPASKGLADLLSGQPGVWLAREISAEALAATLLAALQTLQAGERFAHPFVETFQLSRTIPAYENLIDRSLEQIRDS